ncbi:MAG: flagellar basal body L-ring protein FlgH [Aeoliella sp.]
MHHYSINLWTHAILLVLATGFLSSAVLAQEGSLLNPTAVTSDGTPVPAAPLTLENTSILYQPLPPEAQRELKVNDSIMVLVDIRSSMSSEGNAESRKTSNINARLSDWLGFDGSDIFAAPQSRGDPTIAGSLNSQYRAESDLELRDSLTFRIAATIVEIRPNGHLVIEAHSTVRINDEVWQKSLTGVVARQFINANREVRSDAITNLHIDKGENGQVREGYAPGWFTKWYAKYKPF